jgi:hypothetical protein
MLRLHAAVHARASLRSSRHDFEKSTSIGSVCLVLRAGPVQNVGARSGRTLLINKRACKNIKMFVGFMVFNYAHPVSWGPLDQHCQLPRSRILIEDLAPRAGPEFLPVRSIAVYIGDELGILCACHDDPHSSATSLNNHAGPMSSLVIHSCAGVKPDARVSARLAGLTRSLPTDRASSMSTARKCPIQNDRMRIREEKLITPKHAGR